MTARSEVLVIGAGGAQAQAMLEAAARAGSVAGWTALDCEWSSETARSCDALGMSRESLDIFEEPDRLRELASRARLVANFAGPYYRTGRTVLDACVAAGCDYLDICDDADATLELLALDGAARDAGVRALVGMGSSPGVTNVLVRAAFDALGGADRVELSWVVDVADVNRAAIQHFWHIFSPTDSSGGRHPVPAWSELNRKTVTFPAPLGEQLVIELSHPEPLTLARFLRVEEVRNFGSITPPDALVLNWALTRMGAGDSLALEIPGAGNGLPSSEVALALYQRYLATRESTPYLGGGLIVDVAKGERGLRFSSADKTPMEESTGIPAAAGVALMLGGGPERTGVFSPEILDPAEFFSRLGQASRGTGSLTLHRTEAGEATERLRIRDLLRAQADAT